MSKLKKTICLFSVIIAIMAVSCAKDDPENGPDPHKLPVNTITVNNSSYTLNNGKYYTGFYPYLNAETTNFYLECSSGSGITIELDESLVGKIVYINEQPDTFWFFAIGNGNGTFVQLQNNSVAAPYSGWFKLSRDLETDNCSLSFMINRNEVKGWAMGNIKDTFTRLNSL